MRSELRIFYLDDGTLGGPEGEVLQDLQFIEREAEYLGLHLNRSKTEEQSKLARRSWMLPPPCAKSPLNRLSSWDHSGRQRVSIDTSLADKIQASKTMGARLSHFSKHDAITLLRHSIAIPRVLYLLRLPHVSSLRFSSLLT